MQDAKDLIRFGEDQFTCWDVLPNANGVKPIATPCVYEQYKYRVPVDASAHNVSMAFLDLYEATGDELAFAKAKALIDNMTRVQNKCSGQMPTTWDLRSPRSELNRTFWVNCTYSSITALLRIHELTQKK